MSQEAITPRPTRRRKVVEEQPISATTSGGSNFTKAARQLKQDLYTAVASSSVQPSSSRTQEARYDQEPSRRPEPLRAHSVPLDDRSTVSKRVRLPDVTGLTSAVGSPSRPSMIHRAYSPIPYTQESPSRGIEHRLRSTLAEVQQILAALQAENGLSRSRVLALEAEVEAVRLRAAKSRASAVDLERYETVLEERESD